jgi:hypothetical protein
VISVTHSRSGAFIPTNEWLNAALLQ